MALSINEIRDNSDKLDFPGGKKAHAYEEPTVPEPAYLGAAVFTVAIADDDLGDFKVELGGSKEQVEIAKRIEIAEITPVLDDFLVVGFIQDFGATKSVFEPLTQNVREEPAKEFVCQQVEKPHGVFVHGIYEAAAVDELSLVIPEGIIKFG